VSMPSASWKPWIPHRVTSRTILSDCGVEMACVRKVGLLEQPQCRTAYAIGKVEGWWMLLREGSTNHLHLQLISRSTCRDKMLRISGELAARLPNDSLLGVTSAFGWLLSRRGPEVETRLRQSDSMPSANAGTPPRHCSLAYRLI